ncbi:beta-N-acetylhexosaminidase [Desulfosporosinus youngiae]|uniref:Beta-glucosidase-like glycosyl hydrolase n=1 Tax=Desulfosporosinus youngiae DSM 17734 TaxID=768710 RepID=H5XWH0_9FIRM|nr:beta-N-acetylhexosaminidase [Desulfosporosinus youngiae]EHQ90339.1 beta-glucosidase-like glycosyl hydrolase [Desulfosporosinus youngiae DSM 17734]
MRKNYLLLILVLALLAILGYGYVTTMDNRKNTEDIDPIQEQIKGMSLEEKVGQLVMAGVDTYENDLNSARLLQEYHVGGFVFFKKNVKDANQLLSLINSLKETNSVNKLPLMLAVDEEGGRVSRMPSEFTKLPSSRRIGELNSDELSYRLGGIVGEELKSFGLNTNFAPVLDVFSNPQNQVIGDRAFGDNPTLVSKLGIQTMKGLRSQNIISVVKHFPGHGDTFVDSHVGLPVINHDLNRLKSLELVPFYKAVENKVDAIMLAHILLPKIDSEYPASFSKIIISDILRKEMLFDGVIITDDLTMGAIVNNYDLSEAAITSINAGSDMVLVCHEYAKQEAVLKAMQTAAQTGRISLERIDQSVYRVLKLKGEYALSDRSIESVNPLSINHKIEVLYRDFPSLKP